MIVLFDGVCNLCNSAVDLFLKKVREKNFKLVALQSEEGKKLLKEFDLHQRPNTVLFIQNNQVFSESDAILEICKHLRPPWSWLRALKILPKRFRDSLYRWIATNRYKWFGQRNSCRNV